MNSQPTKFYLYNKESGIYEVHLAQSTIDLDVGLRKLIYI